MRGRGAGVWWGDGVAELATMPYLAGGWRTSTLLRLGIREEVEDPRLLAECLGGGRHRPRVGLSHGKAAGWKVESAALLQALMYKRSKQTPRGWRRRTRGLVRQWLKCRKTALQRTEWRNAGLMAARAWERIKVGMLSKLNESESCAGGLSGLVCRTARLF